MRLNVLIIASLLVIVIAAPVMDALACDYCEDIIPVRDMPRMTNGADQPDADLLPSDEGRTAPKETGAAQDLCPVCSNIAAAIVNACCGAPSMISHSSHLPKLIALSDPSYSITKPPQN